MRRACGDAGVGFEIGGIELAAQRRLDLEAGEVLAAAHQRSTTAAGLKLADVAADVADREADARMICPVRLRAARDQYVVQGHLAECASTTSVTSPSRTRPQSPGCG
jgi:hypothetical protein